MTSLALNVDRARSARGSTLLRGPLPAWAALFANVLAFSGLPTVVPIPVTIGQLVTQGALILAFLLVLLANPGGVVRPSVFLVLLTMLGTVALMVSIHNEFVLGSTYRALRLIAFILVLWLLTPWWGRRDFVLLRAHLTCLRVVLLTVLIGAVIAPGAAFSFQGRLSGALWPIPPTQVAHYAAVLLGCTVVLWFGRAVRGRTALLTFLGAGAALVGTHTRTALLAMIIGLVVAGASMFMGHARVRRTSALLVVLGVTAATLIRTVDSRLVLAWADGARGVAAYGTDQGVVSHIRAGTSVASGAVRIRTVQQVVQRPPDRQQLARRLPGPGLVRPLRRRGPPSGSHRACRDPSPRNQACRGALPGQLLPRRLHQRDGPRRCVALSAQPRRCRVAAGRSGREGAHMTILVVHSCRQPTDPERVIRPSTPDRDFFLVLRNTDQPFLGLAADRQFADCYRVVWHPIERSRQSRRSTNRPFRAPLSERTDVLMRGAIRNHRWLVRGTK